MDLHLKETKFIIWVRTSEKYFLVMYFRVKAKRDKKKNRTKKQIYNILLRASEENFKLKPIAWKVFQSKMQRGIKG